MLNLCGGDPWVKPNELRYKNRKHNFSSILKRSSSVTSRSTNGNPIQCRVTEVWITAI